MIATLGLSLFTLFAAITSAASSGGNASEIVWSFTSPLGPANWTAIGYDKCGGSNQSPVKLDSSSVQNKLMGDLLLTGYTDINTNWTMINSGHGLAIAINQTTHPAKIQNGGLDASYSLHSFHWHVGSEDIHGSEHHLDGEKYSMEMHMVHFLTSNGSLTNSWENPKGLAVLGTFFEVSGSDNQAFEGILKYFDQVKYKDEVVSIPAVSLRNLLPTDIDDYYRYDGSLTTPPCYESVVWTVFKKPVAISAAQMLKFRSLYFTYDPATNKSSTAIQMVDNRRPTMALLDRTVYYNTDDSGTAGSAVMQIYSLLLIVSALISRA